MNVEAWRWGGSVRNEKDAQGGRDQGTIKVFTNSTRGGIPQTPHHPPEIAQDKKSTKMDATVTRHYRSEANFSRQKPKRHLTELTQKPLSWMKSSCRSLSTQTFQSKSFFILPLSLDLPGESSFYQSILYQLCILRSSLHRPSFSSSSFPEHIPRYWSLFCLEIY